MKLLLSKEPFKRMNEKSWVLHLVGGATKDDEAYVQDLKESAEGQVIWEKTRAA